MPKSQQELLAELRALAAKWREEMEEAECYFGSDHVGIINSMRICASELEAAIAEPVTPPIPSGSVLLPCGCTMVIGYRCPVHNGS